jgi:hypothetical protein
MNSNAASFAEKISQRGYMLAIAPGAKTTESTEATTITSSSTDPSATT